MITPERLAASGTEHGNQSAIMCWANLNIKQYPDLRWLAAIPNGGFRDKITAGKLKAEGVKSGLPDLVLLVRRGIYAALWIELKKPKVGRVSKEQFAWIEQAKSQGHAAVVCYGWESAALMLQQYLEFK